MAVSAGKILIMPKGAWDSTTTYRYLDMVTHNDSKWLCKVESCVGIEPSTLSTAYWFAWDDSNVGGSTVTFQTRQSRQDLLSGDTVATLFGKIKKWLIDMKDVAFTGSFGDLTDIPKATQSDLGLVKVDGSTITVTSDGVISSSASDVDAEDVTYDNEISQLLSENVQGAIDETVTKINSKADYITYDEDSSLLSLRSGGESGSVLAQVTIDSGASSMIHVTTTETEWMDNPDVVITIANDAETFNGSFDENGEFYHKVHFLGNYTVSVLDDGETYTETVNVTTIGSIYNVTINPYSYVGWLRSASITDTFGSLEAVLASEPTLRILIDKHASADYLVSWIEKDSTVGEQILDTDLVAKWVNICDYCFDKLEANTTAKAIMDEVDKYGYGEWVERDGVWQPKGNVPVMTSNSAPYGTASASSTLSGHEAYKAFDGDDATWHTLNANTGGLIYNFINPIKVKKVLIKFGTVYATTFDVQASNDGVNFENIYSGTTNKANVGFIDIDNNDYYRYYALHIKTVSASGYVATSTLQFYGRELSVSVPKMTSNTAPWGEAIGKHTNTNHPAWHAFDGTTTNYWMNDESPLHTDDTSLQYDFGKSVLVKKFVVGYYNATYNYTASGLTLKGSNDGVNWTDIKTFSTTSATKGTTYVYSVETESIVPYRYYRLNILGSNYATQFVEIAQLQFYALDYSERTSRRYIYDHGVEVETVETFTSGSSAVSEKLTDHVHVASGTSSQYGVIFSTNKIDLSSYSLMRAKIDLEIAGATCNIGISSTKTSYGSETYSSFTTDSLPNNHFLDVSSIMQEYYVAVSSGGNAGNNLTVKEWWLE